MRPYSCYNCIVSCGVDSTRPYTAFPVPNVDAAIFYTELATLIPDGTNLSYYNLALDNLKIYTDSPDACPAATGLQAQGMSTESCPTAPEGIYTVNSDSPLTTNSGDGVCTLTDAILYINGEGGDQSTDCNLATGSSGYTIEFDMARTITIDSPYAGINGLPIITADVTIDGKGSTIARGSVATAFFRFFEVPTGKTLELKNLTLTGGHVEGNGGGILNAGTLTLINSTVMNNYATGNGGGIWNAGELTLINSAVIGNYATGNGGGIYHTGDGILTIENSLVQDNVANNQGAGIYYAGTNSSVISGTCIVNNWGLTDNSSIFTSGSINANNNWWGMSDGASGDGTGTGDSIRGNISSTSPISTAPMFNGQVCGTSLIILAGAWDIARQGEIFRGAYYVGGALSTMTVSPTNRPIDAFRRVMVNASGRVQIEFSLEGTVNYCTTNDEGQIAPASLVARITCGTGNIFTEFTAVHEFGHLFDSRADGQLYNMMQSAMIISPEPNGEILFGSWAWTVEDERQDDWYRGQRGWGTEARYSVDHDGNPNTPNIETGYFNTNQTYPTGAGPCANAAIAPEPTSFQQNPCHLKDWLYASTITEIDEASADMFLNWVYKSLGIPDESNTGFQNIDWRSGSNPVDSSNPGDQRFIWMETTMNSIFTAKGW